MMARILAKFPPDTKIIFESEWVIRNIKSFFSSNLIDSGTLTAPAYKIPSSPIIHALRPSESNETLSPLFKPSDISPAPTR